MPTESPMPKDHPLMKAWEEYKQTDDYANTRKWALHAEHVDGSLWAAFSQGWFLAEGASRPNAKLTGLAPGKDEQ
jgi:hypothetical protein